MLVLTLPFGAAAQQQAESPDPFARVRELLEEGVSQGRGVSIVVAVARDGEIVWEEGFGWADRERAVPATSRTLYPIGSVTKSMTATAVMILVEAGLIDLDSPANSYLPAQARFRVPTGEDSLATVRRVLVHTAGLPKYWRFPREEEVDQVSMDQTIQRYATAVFPPGDRYNYSNIGYAVLARIVENQTGAEYSTFLKERVTEPLGMLDTRLEADFKPSDERAALYDGEGQRMPRYVTGHGGASVVWTTARDLALYGTFHLDTEAVSSAILSVEARAEMREPLSVHPSIGPQGIGWFHRTEGGRTQ